MWQVRRAEDDGGQQVMQFRPPESRCRRPDMPVHAPTGVMGKCRSGSRLFRRESGRPSEPIGWWTCRPRSH
jgi:hypothetical protein